MSTQTEHLGLHQWEPSDPFLRTDFNEDFAKIDAGVKAAAELPYVVGAFTGQGAAELPITLGRRPRYVIIVGWYATNNGNTASQDIICEDLAYHLSGTFGPSISAPPTKYGKLTDDGFTVLGSACNPAGAVKHYIAFF